MELPNLLASYMGGGLCGTELLKAAWGSLREGKGRKKENRAVPSFLEKRPLLERLLLELRYLWDLGDLK